MTLASGAALRLVVAGALALSAADVMPHCGGPQVVVSDPGQDCGDHGPRWHGDCRAPAACYRLDRGGALCTLPCEKDADCAALGAGATCSAHGGPYEQPDQPATRRLCAAKHE